MKSFISFITLLSIINLTTGAITRFGYQNKKVHHQNSIKPQRVEKADTIKSIIRNDHKGNYVYGFETSDGIIQRQAGEANGSKRGYYSYVDPDGKTYTVCYIADENGYRVVGDPKLGAIREIQCPYDKDKRRPNPLIGYAARSGYTYDGPQLIDPKSIKYGYDKPLTFQFESYQGKNAYPKLEVNPLLPPYV